MVAKSSKRERSSVYKARRHDVHLPTIPAMPFAVAKRMGFHSRNGNSRPKDSYRDRERGAEKVWSRAAGSKCDFLPKWGSGKPGRHVTAKALSSFFHFLEFISIDRFELLSLLP